MRMKTDARVRYTQQALKSALLRLLENKPINKITVKEVCGLAELNRATFYTHYSDCYALLEQIENDLIDDYVSSLRYLRLFDVTDLITAIYDMIERNLELCEVLIFKNPHAAIIKKMIDITHDRSIADWRVNLPKATDDELEMLFICLANGLMNVVVEGYRRFDRGALISFVNTMVKNSAAAYM